MSNKGYTSHNEIEEMKRGLSDEAVRINTPSRLKKSLKIASWVLFTAVVVFLLVTLIWIIIAKSNGKTPSFFGLYIFEVETGSMEPTLPVGTLIVSVRPSDTAKLRIGAKDSSSPGDIVTFITDSGDRVTHRLVDKAYDAEGNFIGYRTQGDNPAVSMDAAVLTFDRILAVFKFKVPLT